MNNRIHPAEKIDFDLMDLLQQKIRQQIEDYFDGNANAEKSFVLQSLLKILNGEELE